MDITYPCPVCGYLVFSGPPGSYDICPICDWEDDMVQLHHPDLAGGANKVSLIEAQRNFAKYGASAENVRHRVRLPQVTDIKDPKWRPWDSTKDKVIESNISSGKEYFDALTPADDILAKNPTALYYWLT